MSSRVVSIVLAAFCASALPAAAQQAAPADRCSGTLCDLYYGGSAPAQPTTGAPVAAPAATPTPLVVPGTGLLGRLLGGGDPQAADQSGAAKSPAVAVEGGGLISMMKGGSTQRCTGTLCDLYYGGSPPDEPGTPAAEPAAVDPAAAPMEPVAQGHYIEDDAREATPRCVSPANDPWRCYRK